MRRSDMQPVPTNGLMSKGKADSSGNGDANKDGFCGKDFCEFGSGKTLGQIYPSLISDQNKIKAAIHLGTWVVALIFAIWCMTIVGTEFAIVGSDAKGKLAMWFIYVHTVAFVFLCVGVLCLIGAGIMWQQPFRRPLLVALIGGLLTASLSLYTTTVPTAAHYAYAAAADANLTVPEGDGTQVFDGANADDMARLRDLGIVIIALISFGLAQVTTYLVYTLSEKK